jgi:DtxR family Mn-dependent transcriptional regulator
MAKIREISESMEDYLEVILELEKTNKVARAKDIAERLAIKRGSVTGALKNLGEKGLINYEPYSFITLTRRGKKIAEEISHRHAVLKDFLLNVLQIDAETAETTACGMEHAIDKKTIERLVCFIEYIHTCPRAGEEWIKSFVNYCTSDKNDRKKCNKCIGELRAIHQRKKN